MSAILQQKTGDGSGTSLDSPVTVGSLLVAAVCTRDAQAGQMCFSNGSADGSWTNLAVNRLAGFDAFTLQAKTAASTSQGPFYAYGGGGGDGAVRRLHLWEAAGVVLAGATVLSGNNLSGSPIDLGDFTGVGAGDLVIIGASKNSGGNPGASASGFTTDFNEEAPAGHPWCWAAHRFGGGTVDAAFTNGGGTYGAAAARFIALPSGRAFSPGIIG